MSLSLESLGLTQEEAAERVIRRIVDELMTTAVQMDEDGQPWSQESGFGRAMKKRAVEAVDKAVADIAEKHVAPNVLALVESTCLQRTNEWGEKKGEPLTFTEYLVQRTEAYILEPVAHDGSKPDAYGRSKQTRIAWLVDKHLQYQVSSAVEAALRDFNTKLGASLAETVKLKLEEAIKGVKVATTLR